MTEQNSNPQDARAPDERPLPNSRPVPAVGAQEPPKHQPLRIDPTAQPIALSANNAMEMAPVPQPIQVPEQLAEMLRRGNLIALRRRRALHCATNIS